MLLMVVRIHLPELVLFFESISSLENLAGLWRAPPLSS